MTAATAPNPTQAPGLAALTERPFFRQTPLVSRLVLGAAVALAVAPVLLGFAFVWRFGVDVPFWDEWATVINFVHLQDGTLTLRELHLQHNEHRITAGRLILLAVAYLTDFNVVAQMYASVVLTVIAGLLLYRVCRADAPNRRAAVIAFVPIAWLLFSFRQIETTLWGFELVITLCRLGVVAALVVLAGSRGLDWRWLGACLCAIVGTFSFGTGLFIWPVGALQIVMMARWRGALSSRSTVLALVAWCVVGAAVCLEYFTSLIAPYVTYAAMPSLQDPLRPIREPLAALTYVVTALGAPLGTTGRTAQLFGILLLPLYIILPVWVALRRTAPSRAATMGVPLAVFVPLSLLAVTHARMSGGVEGGLTSRYTSITLFGVIGLYLLVIRAGIEPRWLRTGLVVLLVGMIAAGTLESDLWGYDEGVASYEQHMKVAYYTSTYTYQSNTNLTAALPGFTCLIRKYAPEAERRRLSLFRHPPLDPAQLRAAIASPIGQWSAANGAPVDQQTLAATIASDQGDTITLTGWALDPVTKRPAGAALARIDDQIVIPALYGQPRQDVVDVLGDAADFNSGFTISFGTFVLTPGRHSVSLLVVNADQTEYTTLDRALVLDVVGPQAQPTCTPASV